MNDSPPVRSYAELLQRIDQLPPPQPGLVRVFRGQPQHYGTMLPSGRRRPLPFGPIWSHHLRRLLHRLDRDPGTDIEAEIYTWILWLQALAQHYGAGSNYLDVTHDVGVAVWFAFHDSKTVENEMIVGNELASSADLRVRTRWVRLQRHAHVPQLYVMDLEPWNRSDLPKTGDLIDLATAPPSISVSERIKVQSGCLVYAGENDDLLRFVVAGTPIAMAGGFDDSPKAAWSTEDAIPGPAVDVWYARLLSLPFMLGPDEARGDLCVRQSLPITLYLSDPAGSYVREVRSRFRYLQPALIAPWVRSLQADDADIRIDEAASRELTVIVLESPQITAHPPVDNPSWNHGLLMSDWCEEVQTYALGSDVALETVGLRNVLIEFSPLEDFGWYEESRSPELLRAAWITGSPERELAVRLVVQHYPDAEFAIAGPLIVRLDPSTKRLTWRANTGEHEWRAWTALPVAKALTSSFVLMRDLSPAMKMAAYPEYELDRRRFLLPVSAGAAHLCRLPSTPSEKPCYFLRDALTQEPFTVAKPSMGTMRIESPEVRAFGEIPAEWLRERLLASEVRHDTAGKRTS